MLAGRVNPGPPGPLWCHLPVPGPAVNVCWRNNKESTADTDEAIQTKPIHSPPPPLQRIFSINQAASSIMHPALQPVTLLQPVNEAARPRGRRRRHRRRSETQPVKSWTSTQMTISKQPGSRQLCQEAKRYRRKSRASSRGLNDRRRLFRDRRERPGLIGGLLPRLRSQK